MRMTTLSRILVPAALVLGVATADTASLRGPVLGYVLDSQSQSIRPVNGIPGAAHLGATLPLPFPVERAAFSSQSDFALAVRADDHSLVQVTNLGAAAPSWRSIPGGLAGADRLVLNLANSAAAVYSAEERRLQVVRGLPLNPSAGPQVDLSTLGERITSLALDTAASSLLVADSDGALHRLTVPDSGEPGEVVHPQLRFLSRFAAPSAIALLNQDRDAVLADAGANQLFLIRNFVAEADVFLLAGERDGISNPVGVEASADGRRVFAATAAALLAIDLETRAVETRTSLDGTLTRLDRLQGRSTFVLNEPGSDPLLILDDAVALEIYFVPAGRNN